MKMYDQTMISLEPCPIYYGSAWSACFCMGRDPRYVFFQIFRTFNVSWNYDTFAWTLENSREKLKNCEFSQKKTSQELWTIRSWSLRENLIQWYTSAENISISSRSIKSALKSAGFRRIRNKKFFASFFIFFRKYFGVPPFWASNLNRKIWIPRRPDKKEREDVAAIDSKPLFRNIEKNRWGGGYFKFNEPKTSSGMEQNKNEPENVSTTEESDVVKPSTNFPIVDRKDYDIAESMILYTQVNHEIEKPKKRTSKPKKMKSAEFNFGIDLKTLIHNTSVDVKFLQLKICVSTNRKKEPPKTSFLFSTKWLNDSACYL